VNIKGFLSRIAAKSESEDMRAAIADLMFKMEISGVHWRKDSEVSEAFDRLAEVLRAGGAA